MMTVIETTDRRFVGLSFNVDPRNPPPYIPVSATVVFNPLTWTDMGGGLWRVQNHNYTAICKET